MKDYKHDTMMDEPKRKTQYTCPMHPEVVKDAPGNCPKCGMKLVPMETKETTDEKISMKHFSKSPKKTYTCPMHPEVKSNKPGKCPKCGMDLVLKKDSEEGQKMSAQEDHGDMPEMTRDMRRPWLWTNVMLIMLGLWLISSPLTFSYENSKMFWSDIISGSLLASFAAIAFLPRYDFIGRWGACFVGIWLQFAPLVFWAPTAEAYITDTLIGALAITFSVLVPMMPGMAHHMEMMKPGPEIPPGWTYNPSTMASTGPNDYCSFSRLGNLPFSRSLSIEIHQNHLGTILRGWYSCRSYFRSFKIMANLRRRTWSNSLYV